MCGNKLTDYTVRSALGVFLERKQAHRHACLAILAIALTAAPAFAQWPQWGGPNRDFTVDAKGLADSWPEDGLRRVWHRELGDGYSSIVADGNRLYTMYRKNPTDTEEYTVALDAKTGATLWQHSNPAQLATAPDERWGGQGPNSTPLVVGDRLYTVGSLAILHCFDKNDGKVLWEHDLARELGASQGPNAGYSGSPMAYRNTIIVPAGRMYVGQQEGAEGRAEEGQETKPDGESHALAAFDQETGRMLWKGPNFEIGFSSPIMIDVGGEDQIVFAVSGGVIGVDPANGELLWRHTYGGDGGIVMTPVWISEDRLFCSSGGEDVGSIMIRLTSKDGKTVPEEVWNSRKVRFIQSNPVRIGDHLFGSSGHNPAIVMGVEIATGKRMWVKRGFEQAAYIHADGKVIFLDWNGELVLATATPENLTIHSRCKVTEQYSLVVPTLVGKTLYVRDRRHIMALDLS